MTLENIRIALRSLVRNRLYSLINMLGLSLGLTVVILIGLFLLDELTFDTFHDKADRIVRVIEHKGLNSDRPQVFASGPLKLALEAEQQFPEVESAVFLNSYQLHNFLSNLALADNTGQKSYIGGWMKSNQL